MIVILRLTYLMGFYGLLINSLVYFLNLSRGTSTAFALVTPAGATTFPLCIKEDGDPCLVEKEIVHPVAFHAAFMGFLFGCKSVSHFFLAARIKPSNIFPVP